MNFETILKELELKYNGSYKEIQQHVTTMAGVTSVSKSKYVLELEHNQSTVQVAIDFINNDIATFKIVIPNQQAPEFSITTIDHFTKLILFKKHIWNVKSERKHLEKQLSSMISGSNFEQVINNNSFEPVIEGLQQEQNYNITTRYSLAFDDKIESIPAILEFHLQLIDLIQQNY